MGKTAGGRDMVLQDLEEGWVLGVGGWIEDQGGIHEDTKYLATTSHWYQALPQKPPIN
ncbi:hypothetical protein G9A89_000280 [Geosiphon pyriformis]|nr:hypothetical protein G9A89_000280 [Geosiphon pyriformis]